MRRWLVRLIILGVVVALAVAGYFPLMAWWQQRAVPKYTTVVISRGRVETVVNSTGTVKPVRTVSVGAFTSGPIKDVNVDYNSAVKKDEVLAVIDPKLAEAALDRDEASLASTQADLKRVQALRDQARNNNVRAKQLLKINNNYISDTDMDQYKYAEMTAEAQCLVSEAAIRQARATRDNSVANLGYTKIVAPEGGIVIERKVDPGQTVAASFQTPELFTIGVDMDHFMFVYASVDEADIGLIHTAKASNREVRFTIDAYQGELFSGDIYQIRSNSTTTQNVVTYPVIVKAANQVLPNGDLKLMPGMTANLSFQIDAKEDVLRVPIAALRFSPPAAQVRPEDRRYVETPKTNPNEATPIRSASEKADQARSRQHRLVWVQEGAMLKAIPVTLGLMENQFAELLEGDLTEGQAVVTGTESLFGPR